jgi:transcriptional regulator with PAS, ATPase and Fis domain
MYIDLFSDTNLVEVAKTGIPQIGRVQTIMGVKRIVSRMPLYKDGQLIGAVEKVVIHNLDVIKDLSMEIEQLETKVDGYRQELITKNKARYTFDDILGISQSIHETKELARKIARTNSTVLLTGESGTGKELFAHSIHQASHRSNGPFIRVNCPSIPFELAESEFFGYEKGAFTGANRIGQKGKFELASGGTIFLDEISAMPLGIQAKLLRIIQEKEVHPIGSSETRIVDFRLIAASNVELPLLVERGSFRADLYYRLSVVPIYISPLRERRDDIPVLVKSLLPSINHRVGGMVRSISPESLQRLCDYQWPGNIRELINVLEQSVISAYKHSEIRERNLPAFLLQAQPEKPINEKDIHKMMKDTERNAIRLALDKTKGNKRAAAKALGISRAGLYQKLHRLKMM